MRDQRVLVERLDTQAQVIHIAACFARRRAARSAEFAIDRNQIHQ